MTEYSKWLEEHIAQLRAQYNWAGLNEEIQTFEDYCEQVYRQSN